jgi:hypothetical protein
VPLPSRTFGGKVFETLWLGVDLWRSYPHSKGLGVKYSFHWVLRGRREALRGALGVVVVRKKAIWSLRLRLHSGLRQQGKRLRRGSVPRASP